MNTPFSRNNQAKQPKSPQTPASGAQDQSQPQPSPQTSPDPKISGSYQSLKNPTPAQDPSTAQISDLARQNAELIGDLQRTRADFENFRKQVESQREQAKVMAKHATVSKFLPLIDDMSRAIKAHPDILTPVQKTLDKTLKTLNLEVIDSKVGATFNPEFHNAISMEDDEGDKEVIAEELIPGYLYDGEVLRAAMVRVKHKK